MPRLSMKNSRFVRKVHIKFESMAPKTLIKYRVAVRRFFWWRNSAVFYYPSDLSELDYQVGEFFNHLYLDESPLGWAQDCISGLKRLFPRCRRHLETATLYYNNWSKATLRVKALPFTPNMVRGGSIFPPPCCHSFLLLHLLGALFEKACIKWPNLPFYPPPLVAAGDGSYIYVRRRSLPATRNAIFDFLDLQRPPSPRGFGSLGRAQVWKRSTGAP